MSEQSYEQLVAEVTRLRARIDELEQAAQDVRAQAEAELGRREQELRDTIAQQGQLIEMIRTISTPVIPVYDEILVLPIVGTIDSQRSARIMEALLTGVQEYQAEVVIIDITGVPLVDTGVANHLIQTTRAATLLGAHCVLVGVSAEVAQTIVQLGVNLTGVTIRSNLQSGIIYALERQGLAITARDAASGNGKNSILSGLLAS